MAPVVHLPSGNVELVTDFPVPTQRTDEAETANAAETAGPASIGWSIRRPDGEIVRSHLASRAEASRMLGSLAAHGASLPLVVYSPDGQSIGEQLG